MNDTGVVGGSPSHQVSALPDGSLSKVELAILVACESGRNANPDSFGARGIDNTLRQKGVRNTLSFTRVMNNTVAGYWFERFWEYYTRGLPGGQLNSRGINGSARDAQKATVDHFTGGGGNPSLLLNADVHGFVLHNGQEIKYN